MGNRFTVVALNGSPHAGIGNTALMLDMLRQPLAEQGCGLEVVTLCEHAIEYCVGCALCMEKGKCWIPDDHLGIVERLLVADGVILASPVYFLHVTAQMKAFLDRSLASRLYALGDARSIRRLRNLHPAAKGKDRVRPRGPQGMGAGDDRPAQGHARGEEN
jgi:multimeric flavodoxin WrbA